MIWLSSLENGFNKEIMLSNLFGDGFNNPQCQNDLPFVYSIIKVPVEQSENNGDFCHLTQLEPTMREGIFF